MGEYAYELVGGLLIVLSSLVGEQMKPEWKLRSYATFVVIAIAFSGIGVYIRREAAGKERTERQERRDEINGLRSDMSKVLATFNALAPSVSSVQRDLEAAKGERDPRVRADFVARARTTQQRIGNSSAGLFVVLVPGTAKQLRSWQGDWNSPEGRTLIINADYVRKGLLQGVEATPDDRAAGGLFSLWPGGFVNWNPEQAASYLESLAARTKIPSPPSVVSIEVK